MPGRNTKTGAVLEQMVLPALKQGGYQVSTQVLVGERPNGRKHFVDAVAASQAGRAILVSLKWQQTNGTAEQKVPFEVMCLVDALKTTPGKYQAAYIVLGGDKWSLRDFYTSGDLARYIKEAESVEVLALETFIAKANRGEL